MLESCLYIRMYSGLLQVFFFFFETFLYLLHRNSQSLAFCVFKNVTLCMYGCIRGCVDTCVIIHVSTFLAKNMFSVKFIAASARI